MRDEIMDNEMQETIKKAQKQDVKDNVSVSNIAAELMRDQILQVVRTSEMKQLRVIENYIDEKVLRAVLNFVKSNKTCETFDVIDNLDY